MTRQGIGGKQEVTSQERSGSAAYGEPAHTVRAIANNGERSTGSADGPPVDESGDYAASSALMEYGGQTISGQGIFSAVQMARIKRCVAEATAQGEPLVPWGIANRPE